MNVWREIKEGKILALIKREHNAGGMTGQCVMLGKVNCLIYEGNSVTSCTGERPVGSRNTLPWVTFGFAFTDLIPWAGLLMVLCRAGHVQYCSMNEKYLGVIPSGAACTLSAAAGWEGLALVDSIALCPRSRSALGLGTASSAKAQLQPLKLS